MSVESSAHTRGGAVELVTRAPDDARAYFIWLLTPEGTPNPDSILAGFGLLSVAPPLAERHGATGFVPVFTVPDLASALSAATKRGALMVRDLGAAAYVQDPDGAWFGLRARTGVVGHGAVNHDYSARDASASVGFYAAVLGATDHGVADDLYGMRFLERDGVVLGGVFDLSRVSHATPSPGWINYFEVQDLGRTVIRATATGSRVRIAPSLSPFNQFAVLDDPWGNTYGLSAGYDPEAADLVPLVTEDGSHVTMSEIRSASDGETVRRAH